VDAWSAKTSAKETSCEIYAVPMRKTKKPQTLVGVRLSIRSRNSAQLHVVPGAGIEPARLAAGDFESPASTNFTTRARSFLNWPTPIE
jgi:hypothetical protein